ncbi:hypothetical protein BGZ93_008257 [Podila epicladia]|nr:hypothetical protein BGZ93_008257 [Podila epicladia]
MAPSKDSDPPVFQAFENKDGIRLQKLRAQNSCSETANMIIFWQDVQNAFPGVDYVDYIHWGEDDPRRAPFLVGPDGEVLHPLRIWCVQCVYRVIYREKPGPPSPALEFQYLYKTWMETSVILRERLETYRETFLELAGNVRYHYSKVLDQLMVLKEMGLKIDADGKTEDQTYGSYTLMILLMVKHGFHYGGHKIPRLDTFKILWDYDFASSNNHLSKSSIEPLVGKAISYLEGLSLPQRGSEVWLTERESIMIKDFLKVPDGCNTLGGLYLYSGHYGHGHRFWTCKQHSRQWLTPGTLEVLVNFVRNCGGQVDTQQATLHVELHSRPQVDQFCTLLHDTELRFHVSVIFGWKEVLRQDLKHFLQSMIDAKVRYLELDGIPYGIHPQGTMQYRSDVFAEAMLRGELWFTALYNYPRPGEQYTYLARQSRVYWLHSTKRAQVGTRDYCDALRDKTGDFVMAIVKNNRDGLIEVLQNLQSLLFKDGFEQVSLVGCYEDAWHGQFDLKESVLREFQYCEFKEWSTPVALEAVESLHTLTLDRVETRIGHKIPYFVQACHQLQELNVSIQESRVLEWVEKAVEMWQSRSIPLHLTLMERGELGRGHIVVQIVVLCNTLSRQGDRKPDRQRAKDSQESPQDWKQGTPELIKVLKWNCDSVSTALTTQTAVILDMVTESHPSMLTSLCVDISHLPQKGFISLQNILRDSTLGHLHIFCTPFVPELTDYICQVLLSVQWRTLQSLIFSGMAVNEWFLLLASISDERTAVGGSFNDLWLQCIRIQGSGKQPVCLSHSSVLFIHRLIYLNPSMELIMEHVSLQDQKDSDLVG